MKNKKNPVTLEPKEIRIKIGVNESGKGEYFSKLNHVHMLAVGKRGTGKEKLLTSIIEGILKQDKMAQFMYFAPSSKSLVNYKVIKDRFIYTPYQRGEEQLVQLNWIFFEIEHRYDQLSRSLSRNITQYNLKMRDKMAVIYIVVEDLVDLISLNPKRVNEILTKILQLGRAAGVFLVAGSSTADPKKVDPVMRVNFFCNMVFLSDSELEVKRTFGVKNSPLPVKNKNQFILMDEHECRLVKLV